MPEGSESWEGRLENITYLMSSISSPSISSHVALRRSVSVQRLLRFLLRRRHRKSYLRLKGEAARVLSERLEYFNRHYQFPYKRVSIRDQRSRWGSCSTKGNINFNYRLILLPEDLRDYVVVHELCHLKELNHSPAFWRLVSETLPDYARLRARLKALERGIASGIL